MSNYNGNVLEGRAILDAVYSFVPAFGRVFVVVNPSEYSKEAYMKLNQIFKPFDNKVRLFTSVTDAYDATDTNNNDVILMDGGSVSHKVTSMLTVSKNRVHFRAMEGGTRRLSNQRCLISNSGAGVATDTAMVKVTGTGNTFKGISFKNNWTVTENLFAVDFSGSTGYFENCTFHNLGSAHLTNANAAALHLTADDVEFVECELGADTVKMTASGGQVVKMDGASTRAIFRDCLFRVWSSQTNYTLFNLVGDGSNNLQLFKNCSFSNRVNGGVTLAVAVKSSAATAGDVEFDTNCYCAGCTDFATAAVGNTGMRIASPVPTAGTSGIAVQPTA